MIFFGLILVFVLIYFLSLFLFKIRDIGNIKNRKFIAFIPTIIIGPIIVIIIFSLLFWSMIFWPQKEFDRIVWLENTHNRYMMSDYIIRNNLLIGKTKYEVIELLGNDIYIFANNRIGYNIGFVPGPWIDPHILIIYFENEIVVNVNQRRR